MCLLCITGYDSGFVEIILFARAFIQDIYIKYSSYFIFLVEEPTEHIKKPIDGEEDSSSSSSSSSSSNSSNITPNASSKRENNNRDPQPPAMADNASTPSKHSSADRQASSNSTKEINSPPDAQTNQAVIEGPDVTAIESFVDGINNVARQLSQGLSFDDDTKEELDGQSHKSDSSLDSNMTAKLAQPNLVPPDVIANWYNIYTFE